MKRESLWAGLVRVWVWMIHGKSRWSIVLGVVQSQCKHERRVFALAKGEVSLKTTHIVGYVDVAEWVTSLNFPLSFPDFIHWLYLSHGRQALRDKRGVSFVQKKKKTRSFLRGDKFLCHSG